MAKILLVGDSFAADWRCATKVIGWPTLLSKDHTVENLAQAGCGQYKIYQQLQSVDHHTYDHIIIWHTSPYRIHTSKSPIHFGDALHANADLIYSDIEFHVKKNQSLQPIMDWFDQYFDLEYAKFVYSLICDRMFENLADYKGKVINCICQESFYGKLEQQKFFFNFHNHFVSGLDTEKISNHFDKKGNEMIYYMVKQVL